MKTRRTAEKDGEPHDPTVLATDESEHTEQLVALCRTVVGDNLRSVIHFTPLTFELLYLRQDLYSDAPERVRAVKQTVVNNERLGFSSLETYEEFPTDSVLTSVFGDYEFTVRVFEQGYVSRVIVGERGILLTTDDIDVARFEELAVAIRRYLRGLPV